ncbi:MAG: beta-lactamase family protein [Bacteroidota bacterium]|nr:beta-lactamase family protein [Bacteroidota bacterium]
MEKFRQMLDLLIKTTGNAPIYNCILYINNEKDKFSYKGASGFADESNNVVTPEHSFRIASISKTFTATVVLQLMEEGWINLNDKFIDLLPQNKRAFLRNLHLLKGNNFTNTITIAQLLQHRSGLCDYYADSEQFQEFVVRFPSLQWNWKSVMEKFFEYGLNQKSFFSPGADFYYSDTNYLLLAIVVEAITGRNLHDEYESRIFQPLALDNTYLEFYQSSRGGAPRTFPYFGNHSLQAVNTSFDWGSGGLVSTVTELSIFIRSLANGVLFSNKKITELMMNFNAHSDNSFTHSPSASYELGIQKKEIANYTFVGHSGAYGVMMYYNPEKDTSIVLTLNQAAAMHKAEWLLKKAVEEYMLISPKAL